MSSVFRVNAPTVLSETIDGEVVILNLDSGNYFNTTGSGALIWEAIRSGIALPAIEAGLAARYGLPADEARAAVGRFVEELSDHALIAPAERAVPNADGAALFSGMGETFAPPELGVHSDMQDLLLLDPIHEVDEMGWPAPARDLSK
jgi:hypothetical protein